MALYDPVNGVYRKVSKMYEPVGGVYRKVKAAYDPVGGVYRKYFSGGIPVSELAVGESVWLNVNGVQTEFLVVHQGNPYNGRYDASCDGTWLLTKDIYKTGEWNSSSTADYDSSTVHKYLNDTFLKMLDATVQKSIKQVKIPYVDGGGSSGKVKTLGDGLSTNVFLLSAIEAGFSTSNYTLHLDGTCLKYFTTSDATRVAYLNGTATTWWMRSPSKTNATYAFFAQENGSGGTQVCTRTRGYRPAFILDSNTQFDNSTGINIIA